MDRWTPEVACGEREERLLKLAGKSRKLLVFLRRHRHELFDEGFQEELEGMYRQTGQLAEGAACLLGTDVEEVCRQAKAPVLLGTSAKAALDIDWSDAEEKQDALNRLVRQVDRLAAWVARHVDGAEEAPPRRPATA
jgi:hypothetical protein